MAVIQVIEDQPSQREFIAQSLRENGYDVICSGNGEEALAQSEQKQPDVILLDIVLPDIEGLDLLSALKKIKVLKDTPVIMVSAQGESDSISNALDLGAQDYIAKPVSLAVLNARIRTALRLSEQQQAAKRSKPKALITGLSRFPHRAIQPSQLR